MFNQHPVNKRFETDKQELIALVQQYLKNNISQTNSARIDHRLNAIEAVKVNNISLALQALEKLRDQNSGIFLFEVKIENNLVLIIRDARRCKKQFTRGTEGFEMQYLNVVRAGMELAYFENVPELISLLHIEAINFIETFYLENRRSSQRCLFKKVMKQIQAVATLFQNINIGTAIEKLNLGKDYANFNDIHVNVATIFSIKQNNKAHIIVEAEIAFKYLTESQRDEYQSIIQDHDTKPRWYTEMQDWEQRLCKKYAPYIIAGKHVICNQLTRIVGMKNAFEKVTAIVRLAQSREPKLKILHTSKHSATLASLSTDEASRYKIAYLNAQQAQEWIGPERKLHCNTFNSGPLVGSKNDCSIVQQTLAAMKYIGGSITNTAFNRYRISKKSSHYAGINDLINTIVHAKQNMALLISDNLFKQAVELQQLLKRAKYWSMSLANVYIALKLNAITRNLCLLDIHFTNHAVSKEEVLSMCTLGKDRTGFKEHMQTAESISHAIGCKAKEIDRQILAAGHTAQQAGGVYSGGSSIGCYGIRRDSIEHFPLGRLRGLCELLDYSSHGNKISCSASTPLYATLLSTTKKWHYNKKVCN